MRMRSMPLPLIRNPARTRRNLASEGLGRTARLALILPDNSGGIVGRGACRLRRRGTAFCLRLAALEVFSQRRAQTPLPPQLLCALLASVHGNNIRKRREGAEEPRNDPPLNRARLRHFHTCGKDRRARSNRYFRNPPGAAVAQW